MSDPTVKDRADGIPKGIGLSRPPKGSKIATSAEERENESTPSELRISNSRDRSKVKKNRRGMLVDFGRRPPGGWGKCRHVDPRTREEVCEEERFNVNSPFCHDHLVFWKEEEAKRKGLKIAEHVLGDKEARKNAAKVDEETFSVKTPQDAIDLLSKLNVMLAREQLVPDVVTAIRQNILAQMRAIDVQTSAKRINALLEIKRAAANKSNPQDMPDELDENTLEEDLAIAKRGGLAGASETPEENGEENES